MLLLLSFGLLHGAQIIDGVLWLEIFLKSGTAINIQSRDSAAPKFTVSEISSPISRELEGSLKISFMNWDKLPFWGVLNRIEPLSLAMDDPDFAIQQSFVWQDSCLVLRQEKLVFEPESFTNQASALRYAQETGIPKPQVRAIPMLNATVKVQAGNHDYYFETPLLIQTENSVHTGDQKLGYSGQFILKAIGEKLVLTHFLPLEDYIGGVIQNEIGSSAPLEALKSQAVTARTHAVSLLLYNRHKGEGYDLCNGTHCQVYKGEYLSNANIRKAITETSGQILMGKNRVADATYHSSCGGKTDSSVNIWKGQPVEHLMGVTCITEAESHDLSTDAGAKAWINTRLDDADASSWEKATLQWTRQISRANLTKNLGLSKLSKIEILKRGNSGRIIQMRFTGNKTLTLDSEYKIRQAFGGLPSSFFYITQNGATVAVKGKGAGHGVGMCQVGTLRLARAGWSYQQILARYYPGTQLSENWLKR